MKMISRVIVLGNNPHINARIIDQFCEKNSQAERKNQYGIIKLSADYSLKLVQVSDTKLLEEIQMFNDEVDLGYIILIDNRDPNYIESFLTLIKSSKKYWSLSSLAIGLIDSQGFANSRVDMLHKRANALGIQVPIFEVDPEDKSDFSLLMKALLIAQDSRLSSVI